MITFDGFKDYSGMTITLDLINITTSQITSLTMTEIGGTGAFQCTEPDIDDGEYMANVKNSDGDSIGRSFGELSGGAFGLSIDTTSIENDLSEVKHHAVMSNIQTQRKP